MRERDFIGKKIDVSKIEMLAFAYFFDKTFDRPVIDVDLNDLDREADTGADFNRYSVRVHLTGDRISAIRRIGHREKSGEDEDVELLRFPYNSLENQAQDRLRILVTELSPSASD